jgi:pimeloyl-ACP methyl ester carboxylesterase/GNAT superfamily N-acetyltransferase
MAGPGPGRDADTVTIRRADAGDAEAIGDVWLASWRATFDFEPGHPDDDVRRWLATELLPRNETWVAVDGEGAVVGLMALSDAMVEQLYVAPAWIGRGLGRRFVDLAKERRPAGLDLYCFQVNGRARHFYEREGFRAIAFGDGSGNEERQPDIRYAWRPGLVPTPPSDAAPSRTVSSSDGTPIAVFTSGTGPPLVLVHGAAADHTTFRVVGPRLAARFTIHAIDRRGRGASGDTLPYAIEREFEDLATVASALAGETGGPVDIFGHSYGGRCALGAALLTDDIGRVISYEGAPTPPGERYGDAALAAELADLAKVGRNETLLEAFMSRVVGMTAFELDRYRADPVWPRRVAAAATIARELAVESGDAAGIERLGRVRQPVLQLLGGESRREFGVATAALDDRLADGTIIVIPGAKHAAHHTHPDEVVEAVSSFLDTAAV